MIRGIRGATTINENNRDEILESSWDLISQMVKSNSIRVEDISCIIFTATSDITATFPAYAVRLHGKPWSDIACIDVQQMETIGGMKRVIRVLMQAETEKKPDEIIHPYLRGAAGLRPDRAKLT